MGPARRGRRGRRRAEDVDRRRAPALGAARRRRGLRDRTAAAVRLDRDRAARGCWWPTCPSRWRCSRGCTASRWSRSCMPGRTRRTAAHQLGYGVVERALGGVAARPPATLPGPRRRPTERGCTRSAASPASRVRPAASPAPRSAAGHACSSGDGGGDSRTRDASERARRADARLGVDRARPCRSAPGPPTRTPRCCDADVVVTHAGQNAIAEVAARRRPAVVDPRRSPARRAARRRPRSLAAGGVAGRGRATVPDARGWRGPARRRPRASTATAWSAWCDGARGRPRRRAARRPAGSRSRRRRR